MGVEASGTVAATAAAGAAGTSGTPPGGMRERAVNSVMWATVEKWSVRLSTFIAFVILGNLLSPTAFGVVALAMTFINILATVADAGFSSYLLQLRDLTQRAMSTAFWTTTAMAVVLAAALALSAPAIAGWLDAPELEQVLPVLAVYLVIAGLGSVPLMLLRRELRFKTLAIRQISATVVSSVLAVGLALGGAGVWALVVQTVVRGGIAMVVLWATTDFRPRWGFDRTGARAMVSYGSQALGARLSNQLRSQGEVFLIGAMAGPAAAGFWVVAGRLVATIVDTLTTVVSSVAHPVFARLQDDVPRLARALGRASALGAVVVAPVLVALSLVSAEVVPAVFGDQWATSASLASVLAVRSLLRSLTQFNTAVLLATGHPRPELVINLVTLVVQLGLVALLVDHLVVMAMALTAVMALTVPVRVLVVRRLVGVPAGTSRSTAAILLATGVAAGAALGAQEVFQLQGWAYVSMVAGVGAVIYAGMVLLVARPVLAEGVDVLRTTVAKRRGRTAKV